MLFFFPRIFLRKHRLSLIDFFFIVSNIWHNHQNYFQTSHHKHFFILFVSAFVKIHVFLYVKSNNNLDFPQIFYAMDVDVDTSN